MGGSVRKGWQEWVGLVGRGRGYKREVNPSLVPLSNQATWDTFKHEYTSISSILPPSHTICGRGGGASVVSGSIEFGGSHPLLLLSLESIML